MKGTEVQTHSKSSCSDCEEEEEEVECDGAECRPALGGRGILLSQALLNCTLATELHTPQFSLSSSTSLNATCQE